MKTAEREATRWCLQAKDDYKFVNWVMKEGVFFDKGCFVAQQAGEKILKACLYATGKRRVIGHSLFELVEELSGFDNIFEKISESAKRLDRFYITTRYPNGLPGGSPYQLYSISDLQAAVDDLKPVFQVSTTFLHKKGIEG